MDDVRDDVEEIAEKFISLIRNGSCPSISQFEHDYPEHAVEIRELFPSLIMMEQFGSVDDEADEPTPLCPLSADAVPDQLGDYRILRQIGRGGMGIVFEAVHESLGRQVALKVLPAEQLSSEIQVARFRREARAAARLHHTNIVPVFDVGTDGNIHFYAMQLIRGQSLDEVLVEVREIRERPPRECSVDSLPRSSHGWLGLSDSSTRVPGSTDPSGPMSSDGGSGAQYFRQVALVAKQIAEAVNYAHGQGVLHRDIKPANVLLDFQGTAWIADFGLAKSDQRDVDDLTRAGGVVGTMRYMAPERFSGESFKQSDIYGIGTTLYELLTLRPAFHHRDRLRLMQSICNEAPKAPRQIDPSIPKDLETIVLKCLDKDVERRYQEAGDLADDLSHVLADRPITARRTAWTEKVWRWCRRNPAVASLTVSLALLLSLGIAGGLVTANSWRRQRDLVRSQSIQLAEEKRAVENARREAIEHLWEARFAHARAARSSPHVGRRLESLNAIASAAKIRPRSELRNEAISTLSVVDLEQEETWSGMPNYYALQAIDFSPNHEIYACETSLGVIGILEAGPDAALLRTLPEQENCGIARILFDPSGQRLGAVYYRPETSRYFAVVWEWDHREPVEVYRDESDRFINRLAFSSNGLQIALASSDGIVRVVDLPTGETTRRYEAGPRVGAIVFSHVDDSLAVSNAAGDLLVFQESDTRTTDRRMQVGTYAMAMSWSPNGREIAVACKDRSLRFWNIDREAEVCSMVGHSSECAAVEYHPSGRFVLSSGWDGKTLLWNRDEKRVVGAADGFAIGFSTTGSHVAIEQGNQLTTYRVELA
ncbi:MAG: serine/threonine-protein kinase, partial [Planctomycetota bacterium]